MFILYILAVLLVIVPIGIGVFSFLNRVKPSKKAVTLLVIRPIVGLVLMFAKGAFYYADGGYNYFVQYPTGKLIGETEAGLHLKWWGKATPFKKFITVKADNTPDPSVSASIPAIEGRFTDSVVASIEVTARFKLPTEPDKFLALAKAFRTQDNLENSTLVPVLKEVVRNSARSMTAQDYIAGKGGEFENSILDQLKHGIYFLEVISITPEGKADINVDSDRGVEQSQVVRYVVKKQLDKDGSVKRKVTSLNHYGITVEASNVANVDPEPKFKQMLAKQRDAAAEASVKKQEAKKAEYDKQKIIAEGEAQKAQIKVDLEKEQIRTLITAETAKKEASIALDTARILKKKEIEKAETKKIAAKAEAFQKSEILKADGQLDKKLAAFIEVNKFWAAAFKERKVSQFQLGASSNGTSDNDAQVFMKMMGMKAMKDLSLDMGIK